MRRQQRQRQQRSDGNPGNGPRGLRGPFPQDWKEKAMRCKILHESGDRIRVHLYMKRMSLREADQLESWLAGQAFVRKAAVFERTADAVIRFRKGERDAVVRALAGFSFDRMELPEPAPSGRALNREYEEKLVMLAVRRGFCRLFVPMPVRTVLILRKAAGYLKRGIGCLSRGKLEVPVLDATAITVAIARNEFPTAGSIMFMLQIGELLEEWTHKKSVDDLARTMSLNVDQVWTRTEDGQEVLAPVRDMKVGDTIIVRMGSMIPLDGKVTGGAASVNQASMTGESLPVRKEPGSYAYAGTVVEEGEIEISVSKEMGSGRYDRVVKMIEESEKLKSATEAKASHLADRLVPYSLGGTILTWLVTRNITKTLSILMVDYSCALKLAMPISVLSAMREAGDHKILVKGGKYLEAVADADTIVFDKTGTLTCAEPHVAEVVTFGNRDEEEMLRLAACLEEHYPHSIANAVVAEARKRGLNHEERHAKVEYVVAHGISSRIDGKKVILGSRHFVFEDEKIPAGKTAMEKLDKLPEHCSHLFMAIGGRLAAVICIEDSIRAEAPAVVEELRSLGISKIVMMTGDSRRTAAAVAKLVGVDEYKAEVLPEDKASFIRGQHEAGRKVIMVGDGVNDSPALSEADAGIAISEGAAIAREIADITISEEELSSLVTLRRIAAGLSERTRQNYRTIMSFNTGLILLGVAGIFAPQTAALLHNLSTLAIGMHSMTDLLPAMGG